MELSTARLQLRSLCETDLERFYDLYHTEFVQRYNCMQPMDRAQTASYLAAQRDSDKQLAITLPEGLIGMVYIHEDSLRHGVNSIEVSYWLGESYSRRGYMTEALSAVLERLFTVDGYASVTARAFGENEDSMALLRGLGFIQEGRLCRAIRTRDGAVYDDVLFSLTREDWQKNRTRQAALIHEKSCGAVVWARFEDGIRYLMVQMRKGHVDFAKGHMEPGEDELQTAAREIWEETGLIVELDPGFRVVTTYSPYAGCIKDVVYFTARAGDTETAPQPSEIRSLRWATLEEARELLTYDNARTILEAAHRYLEERGELRPEPV